MCVCPSMPGVLYGIFWFSMYDILSGSGFSIVCEKIAIEFNTTHGTRCVKFYSYFFAWRMSQRVPVYQYSVTSSAGGQWSVAKHEAFDPHVAEAYGSKAESITTCTVPSTRSPNIYI